MNHHVDTENIFLCVQVKSKQKLTHAKRKVNKCVEFFFFFQSINRYLPIYMFIAFGFKPTPFLFYTYILCSSFWKVNEDAVVKIYLVNHFAKKSSCFFSSFCHSFYMLKKHTRCIYKIHHQNR